MKKTGGCHGLIAYRPGDDEIMIADINEDIRKVGDEAAGCINHHGREIDALPHQVAPNEQRAGNHGTVEEKSHIF